MSQYEFQPTFLLNVLKDKYLSVPRYQRSYSWTEDEVGDFWSDIEQAIAESREYFFGTIVLSAEAEAGMQSIIDGQQRIATTTILLAVIRDAFKANSLEEPAAGIQNQYLAPYDISSFEAKPRLRLNTTDNPYYVDAVIGNSDPDTTADSHELMKEAKAIIKEEVDAIISSNPTTWRKLLAAILSFLESKARVILVKAPTDADAFTIFETLNDRGADLTIADLLKNYLFSTSREEINFVQNNWIEATTILNLYQPNRDFVNFLRHLWSSKHGATRERDLYRSIKDKIRTKEDAVELSKLLVDGAKFYGAILSAESDFWKDYDNNTKSFMDSLIRLDLEQNRPLLLAILQHFTKKETEKAIKALVSWSIRGLVAGVIGGGKAERYFCEAAVDIRAGKIKTAADLLVKMSPIVPSDAAFLEDFERFRTTSNALARHMLFAIERSMRGEKEPELVPNEDVESVNLEHILARNSKTTDWPTFSPEEANVFAYRLGNMTLLKKSENNKIGNKAWAIKKPIIAKSSLKLNEEIAKASKWEKAEIIQRQQELAKRAVKIWSL